MVIDAQPATRARRGPGAAAGRRRRPPTQPRGFDRAYWLGHCEGYRVDAADGRLGFVEEVRPAPAGEPTMLAVRAGRLGRRLLLVPDSEVAFIVPRAQTIWLRSPVAVAGTEPAPGAAVAERVP
jgi:hypothetical protein